MVLRATMMIIVILITKLCRDSGTSIVKSHKLPVYRRWNRLRYDGRERMRLCDGFQSQGFDGSKVWSDRVLPLGVQDGPGMNGRAARFSAAQAVQV